MPEWIGVALTAVEPYWPFFVKLLTFWFVGQSMKNRVFTKSRASRSVTFALLRETLWAHAIVAGIAWGLLFPWMPAVGFVTTRGGAVTEGILAGVASTVAFALLDRLAEARGWVWVYRALHDISDDRPSILPRKP